MTEPSRVPFEIDPQSVQKLLQSDEPFLLLDCREPDEYQLARIEGARLIPLAELPQRLAELNEYRQRRVVVHCHHGGRSHHAAMWLRQQGFMGAQNMVGGIDRWSLEVDPSVPRY